MLAVVLSYSLAQLLYELYKYYFDSAAAAAAGRKERECHSNCNGLSDNDTTTNRHTHNGDYRYNSIKCERRKRKWTSVLGGIAIPLLLPLMLPAITDFWETCKCVCAY